MKIGFNKMKWSKAISYPLIDRIFSVNSFYKIRSPSFKKFTIKLLKQ